MLKEFVKCQFMIVNLDKQPSRYYLYYLQDNYNRMQRERSRQREHREKKEKKQKKQKKQKKEKKRDRSRSKEKHIHQPEHKNIVSNWQPPKKEQQMPVEKTHGSCRRCKEPTFSLVTRTCSNCGYPKESRPAYFPVTKEVQVLDLVRAGKLTHNSYAPVMIEVVCNDRMGKRQRVKCCPTDTIFDLKKLISAQIGTRPEKIRLQKANIIFKDHIMLQDYEIKDGMGLQMYYD